jgi:enolase
MGDGQIKSGSASRSERFAEYNRLLEIKTGKRWCSGHRSPSEQLAISS